MNLKNINKKIVYLAIVLLILAGILVVALKGFNVDLMLERHESLNFIIGSDFDIKDVKNICKEVFSNKKVVVRKVELFSDTVNINTSSITDEEKEQLVTKLNEKYGTTVQATDLTVRNVPKVRIRDLVIPYIVPIAISILIIASYMIIRFRKMNSFKLLFKIFAIILITELSVASVVAILRVPFSGVLVNLMAILAMIELISYISKTEKNYNK